MVEGAAFPHLLQGERHMVEIRSVTADAKEVEQEIIGFRMQDFRLRAVAAVHMVSKSFQHASDLGHNRCPPEVPAPRRLCAAGLRYGCEPPFPESWFSRAGRRPPA